MMEGAEGVSLPPAPVRPWTTPFVPVRATRGLCPVSVPPETTEPLILSQPPFLLVVLNRNAPSSLIPLQKARRHLLLLDMSHSGISTLTYPSAPPRSLR
jgi:hypothetical protein